MTIRAGRPVCACGLVFEYDFDDGAQSSEFQIGDLLSLGIECKRFADQDVGFAVERTGCRGLVCREIDFCTRIISYFVDSVGREWIISVNR